LQDRQLPAEERDQRKRLAFSKLRKDRAIPRELIDLVERSDERSLVRLEVIHDRDGSRGVSRVRVRVIGFVDAPPAGKVETDEKKNAMTASEALAFALRLSLAELKRAERQRARPVRDLRRPSRSWIGEIALDLLNRCEVRKYSPGPKLSALFRELLNLQSYKHGTPRSFNARERAISIIVQQPDIGVRKLAGLVNVHPSTVTRWYQDPDFDERIRSATEPKARGLISRILERRQNRFFWDVG
jgi:hypothetical protein